MRNPSVMPSWPLLAAMPAEAAKESVLGERAAMERFLAGVERRAFRMARFAVRDGDDALDIVQDTTNPLYKTARERQSHAIAGAMITKS